MGTYVGPGIDGIKVCICTDCKNLSLLNPTVWCGRELSLGCRLDLTNQAIFDLQWLRMKHEEFN